MAKKNIIPKPDIELKPKFNLLIIFAVPDEVLKEKIVTDVSNYGLIYEDVMYFEKNGAKSYLNRDHVLFMGREEDYK